MNVVTAAFKPGLQLQHRVFRRRYKLLFPTVAILSQTAHTHPAIKEYSIVLIEGWAIQTGAIKKEGLKNSGFC